MLGGVGLGIGLSLLGQRPAYTHIRIPFHLYEDPRRGSYQLDNTHITGIRFRIGNSQSTGNLASSMVIMSR
jgi:hypothetical protein